MFLNKSKACVLSLAVMLTGILFVPIEAEEGEATNHVAQVPDRFNRGTPKGSVDGFLLAADKGQYEKAAEYLDLRNLRGEASQLSGAQLARRFNVVINRATWMDIDNPSEDPEGRLLDSLPNYRDSIGVVLSEGKEVRLLMQKVPREDGASIWKVSNATVSLIPRLYGTYGYAKPVEDLRRLLPEVTFLGYELFKLVILFAVALLTYGSVYIIALVIERTQGTAKKQFSTQLIRFIKYPFATWLTIILVITSTTSLGRGDLAERVQQLSPLSILITLWVFFEAINLILVVYGVHLLRKDRPGAAVFLRPAANAAKLILTIVATLIYLDKLGFNITTVLAGLGVGGIAVALALQKPMEDVFGAVTLYAQQPIRIGDFCRIGSQTGTIEEIGLRTTLIRTLEDTLIAIPNAQLANEPIDNISARKKIRFRPLLRLRYDTTPAQLQEVLDNIRSLLESDPQVLPVSQRVRFMEISDDGLIIEVNCYLDTTDWATYLEMAETLNLQLLQIISDAKTSLSAPARTLYIDSDGSTKALKTSVEVK